MLVDRYPPADLFALVPALYDSFEPVLRELDRLLDDDAIVQRVKGDLARRARHTLTLGRHSTPVEVIVRLLVVKWLYRWSSAESEHFGCARLELRYFCRVYLGPVPDETTLIRWANLIARAALEQLNERVVELARSLKVTRGRKLRVDSTVVATNIHHPSDSSLLGDGVRVLSRLLRRAKPLLHESTGRGRAAFRTRTRSARRLTQTIHRLARRTTASAAGPMRHAYARLLAVARQSRTQAARVCAVLQTHASGAAQRLVEHLETFGPRVEQAIRQTARRVLAGEQVPAREKLVSLFEPHTQIHVRQKAGKRVEFGRKVLLDEVEGGIVTRFALLPAPGTEHNYLEASLTAHQQRFGQPPDLLAGDRGLSSIRNERLAHEAGVRRVVLPRTGRTSEKRKQMERARWFRQGFRFRAGIEGRISVLSRRYGLDRCRDRGERGMGRWIGWGIVTANLVKIAETVTARLARRAAEAA